MYWNTEGNTGGEFQFVASNARGVPVSNATPHIEPLRGELNGNKEHDARVINENTEYWIRRFPTQYLFMYNRYKQPAGAPLSPDWKPEPGWKPEQVEY